MPPSESVKKDRANDCHSLARKKLARIMDPSEKKKLKKRELKTAESSSSNVRKNEPLSNYYTVMAPYGDTGTLRIVGISRSATLSSMYRYTTIIMKWEGCSGGRCPPSPVFCLFSWACTPFRADKVETQPYLFAILGIKVCCRAATSPRAGLNTKCF